MTGKNKNKVVQTILIFLLVLFQGIICGFVGSFFGKSISFVTELRNNNFWLIFLLPLAGLLSVLIYKVLRTQKESTTKVIKSIKGSEKVSVFLMPAVFLGSVLTHLCGGSAGREGAALQMGGSTASVLAKVFKIDSEKQSVLTMAGMAGFFSALFGTPFGAAIFVIEVARVGKKAIHYVVPTFISSFVAYAIVLLLKVKPERFSVGNVLEYNISTIVGIFFIAALGAFLSVLFCKALEFSKDIFKRFFKNEFMRIFAGGFIIAVLTIILGTSDYNGGGIDIIEKVFEEDYFKNEAFLLKIVFTAITVAAGYKGGEIIPTLFIGATFGGTMASLMCLNVPLGAAVGITTLFGGVTKCPIATFIISVEMFGIKGVAFYAAASLITYFLSGKDNLYEIEKGIWK